MAEATSAPGAFPGAAPARRLDLRGQTCPTTSDETLRVLEQMPAGAVLEVVSDYSPARSTIPYHCDKRGYRYAFGDVDPTALGPSASGRAAWAIRIQKA